MSSPADDSCAIIEALKNEGNEFFKKGKLPAAIAKFREATQVKAPSAPPPAAFVALAVLAHSNLSQALLDSKQPAAAAEAALRARTLDGQHTKSHVRYLKALLGAERPFEAFVEAYTTAAPVLADLEGGAVLKALQTQAADACGIEDLSPFFALQAQPSGGFGGVATGDIAAGRNVFVEAGLLVPGTENLGGDLPVNVSTEVLVVHFAGAMLPDVNAKKAEIEQKAKARQAIDNAMLGSWPRSKTELAPELRMSLALALAKAFPATDSDLREAVLLLAARCRYNCFQSGFFRCCALLNHSCSPNTAMKLNRMTGAMTLLVVKPIKKGDPITVKYLDDAQFLLGAAQRRATMHQSWLFYCTCPRCVAEMDPAEATSEFLRCCNCKPEAPDSFVHTPGPVIEDADDIPEDLQAYGFSTAETVAAMAKDPLLPKAPRTCSICGTPRVWSVTEVRTVLRIRRDIEADARQASRMGVGDFIKNTLERLRDVTPFVHRMHWVVRSILVFAVQAILPKMGFSAQRCLTTRTTTKEDQAAWRELFDAGNAALTQAIEVATKGQPLDVVVGCEGEGPLSLRWMSNLWVRMSGFYPAGEAHMVHMLAVRIAVCDRVAFSQQLDKSLGLTLMSHDEVKAVLERHLPYVAGDTAALLATLSKLTLPPAELRQLKKLFE